MCIEVVILVGNKIEELPTCVDAVPTLPNNTESIENDNRHKGGYNA